MPTLNLSAIDYSRVVNKSHAAIELESAELGLYEFVQANVVQFFIIVVVKRPIAFARRDRHSTPRSRTEIDRSPASS